MKAVEILKNPQNQKHNILWTLFLQMVEFFNLRQLSLGQISVGKQSKSEGSHRRILISLTDYPFSICANCN